MVTPFIGQRPVMEWMVTNVMFTNCPDVIFMLHLRTVWRCETVRTCAGGATNNWRRLSLIFTCPIWNDFTSLITYKLFPFICIIFIIINTGTWKVAVVNNGVWVSYLHIESLLQQIWRCFSNTKKKCEYQCKT